MNDMTFRWPRTPPSDRYADRLAGTPTDYRPDIYGDTPFLGGQDVQLGGGELPADQLSRWRTNLEKATQGLSQPGGGGAGGIMGGGGGAGKFTSYARTYRPDFFAGWD